MIPIGINNLFGLLSSLDLLFKLGWEEVWDTLSLKWLVKLGFYWERWKTFQDLKKKKKQHSACDQIPSFATNFRALFRSKCCGDQRNYHMGMVCVAQKSLLGGQQEVLGKEYKKGLYRVNLSPVLSSPRLAIGTSGTSWARGRIQTIVFNCHWWTYPPWICLIFFWTRLYFWPLQHPVAVNSTT